MEEEIKKIRIILEEKEKKYKEIYEKYKDLHNIFFKDKEYKNIILELKANEILSERRYLQIIEKNFENDFYFLWKEINKTFQNKPLQFENINIKNYSVLKSIFYNYFQKINEQLLHKFDFIETKINQLEVDVDKIKKTFFMMEKKIKNKIEIFCKTFEDLEKKYLTNLKWLQNKIMN